MNWSLEQTAVSLVLYLAPNMPDGRAFVAVYDPIVAWLADCWPAVRGMEHAGLAAAYRLFQQCGHNRYAAVALDLERL